MNGEEVGLLGRADGWGGAKRREETADLKRGPFTEA